MKTNIVKIAVIVCLIVIILDQGTKILVSKLIPEGMGTENLRIELTENTGMAFGFNDGNTKNIFLTIFVLVIIVSFLKNQKNELDTKTIIAVSLALGGGLSNLIDRIFRGGILDFIGIWKFPRFNIADICVCVAWILLIIFLILYSNKKDVIKGATLEELKVKEKDEKEKEEE